MNTRATVSNDRTFKENGKGTVDARAIQDAFEVAVEI
jgi:hypothetical protein